MNHALHLQPNNSVSVGNEYVHYDPHSKCIRIIDPNPDQRGDEIGRGVTLCGVVVDASPSAAPFLARDNPHRAAVGEIVEIIVDPSRENEHDDAVDREPLIRKHRRLEALHARRDATLLHKQERDRKWFHEQDLNGARLTELEALHRKEWSEVRERQRRERCEMLDSMLDRVLSPPPRKEEERLGTLRGGGGPNEDRESSLDETRKKLSTAEKTIKELNETIASLESEKSDLEREGMVTKLEEDLRAARSELDDSRRIIERLESRASECDAAMRQKEDVMKKLEGKLRAARSEFKEAQCDIHTLESRASEHDTAMRRKDDTVTRLQNELGRIRSASDDKVELKRWVTKLQEEPTATRPAKSAGVAHKSAAKSLSRRADEIRAVMRRKDLSREERQRRLRELRDRFQTAPSRGNCERGEPTFLSLQTEEKQDSIGEIKAKDTATPDRRHASGLPVSEGDEMVGSDAAPKQDDFSRETARNRWNSAVVKTVTANVLTRAAARSCDDNGVPDSNNPAGGSHRNDTDSAMDASDRSDECSQYFFNKEPQQQSSSARTAITKPTSFYTSQTTIPEDPLENLPTDRTPIKKIIKKLNNNDDPSLTVLRLDGRKKIKQEDWVSLFESLEKNYTLTHLSVSRCELSDELAVSLVLALVENETLRSLHLNGNSGLSDKTAKGFVKVLLQSNKTLKILELSRTAVSKKVMQKLNKILKERDDGKVAARIQKERQEKIRKLLSFSAGDELADEMSRSRAQTWAAGEEDDNDQKTFLSKRSRTSKKSSASFHSRASFKRSTSPRGSRKSSSKRRVDASSCSLGQSRGRAGMMSRQASIAGRGGMMTRQASMACMTAKSMSQLGGDITNVGGDSTKLKEQRKFRGECEVCGRKCYTKTMFKMTPLTIPNAVLEGRCLKCNPMI